MYVLLRLVRFALKYKIRLAFAYLSVLAVTVFALTVPRLLGIAVDEVVGSGEFKQLVYLSLGILLVNSLRGIAAFFQQYLSESTAHLVAYDIRNSCYTLRQPVRCH